GRTAGASSANGAPPVDRIAPFGHGGAELGQHAREHLAPDGAVAEHVREHAAVGERLRRLAERVDKRVIPRAAVADRARERGEAAGDALEAPAQGGGAPRGDWVARGRGGPTPAGGGGG